ncbi:DNA topoisomerase I, mitochondrial isoform X1 [Pelobates cultripes]|nr:DNA topoisomerase I, mitochondrial isoform X1 [Pelobates cultripes]
MEENQQEVAGSSKKRESKHVQKLNKIEESEKSERKRLKEHAEESKRKEGSDRGEKEKNHVSESTGCKRNDKTDHENKENVRKDKKAIIKKEISNSQSSSNTITEKESSGVSMEGPKQNKIDLDKVVTNKTPQSSEKTPTTIEKKKKQHSDKSKDKNKTREELVHLKTEKDIAKEKFQGHSLTEFESDLKNITEETRMVEMVVTTKIVDNKAVPDTEENTADLEKSNEKKESGSAERSKKKEKLKKSGKEKREKELEEKIHKKKDHSKHEKSSKGIKREVDEEPKKESSETKKKKYRDKSEKHDCNQNDEGSSSRKRKVDGGARVSTAKKIKVETKAEDNSKWKWWEEANYEDGVKWKFLEHKGPYFAPLYEPLPDNVRFYYDGNPMKLTLATEEVATFYAKMLDHEYTTKEVFQKNFFADWKEQMTSEERKLIRHLHKCDFTEIHKYYVDKNEARKALPKEEKQKLKEEASKLQEEYGYCTLDGHREKIGNFKIEPPGLFRGRGDHPKMGMLKLRIMPEDVIINCSKESKVPAPPAGHKWKEVRYDNSVTWLASWTENIQNSIKYIMLNPSSKLKGEKDWQKYETARRLKNVVDQIRSQYRADWKSREMKKRQRAVALYFIDKLALRAGNEKEEGETADTVGCCSLRVEHIQLHSEIDGQKNVVEFDFLGKDSIRYYNKVPVEKEVFKNLKLFMENKDPDDDLFDRLNTTIVNKHLQDLMDGLTAKVFRTYNASITLQNQLKALTNADDNVAAKILSYNRANRAVALLCNHQRALPKTFEKSMQNLQAKIDAKEQQVKDAKKELKNAKADHKARKTEKSKKDLEKKDKQYKRLEDQLMKLKLQATDKEENKQIALGTSKLNYLDPRISVAWCKKFGVPIEKIYNKTQRDKFAWAIDMTDEDFEF